MLFLEDADGASAEVDSTELANLLADQTSLRLVVLNSCEGARTTLTDPYAGVATTLVQLGVPAVVAMQFEISDAAAILFAEELYVNLIGRQDPIDAAVAEARKAIYIEQGGVEWATPVLFMGDVDVELFRFEIDAAPLPPPPPPDPAPWGIIVQPGTPIRRQARRRWATASNGVRFLLVLAGVLLAALLIAFIVSVVAAIRDIGVAAAAAAVSLLPGEEAADPEGVRVRVQEGQPADRAALPRRRRHERHPVGERRLGPAVPLLPTPAIAVEQHDRQLGLHDEAQRVADGDHVVGRLPGEPHRRAHGLSRPRPCRGPRA